MKLIMLKGLPGSGKSSWARQYIQENPQTKRINKDDLRQMLDNGRWTKANEKFVLLIRDTMAQVALDSFDVIIDDTNLHPKHELHLREIAKEKNANFEIKSFLDIPIEQCIEQDLKRTNSVGEKVIRDMYRQFLQPRPELALYDATLPFAIICDLDGTLALFGDKNPYDRDFINDQINPQVHEILLQLSKKYKVLIVSGRNGKYKQETLEWLDKFGVPHDELFIRAENDKRKDSIVKEEIYRTNIQPKYNIWMVLDDRNQVVEMWRSLGLTCLQVAPGDF